MKFEVIFLGLVMLASTNALNENLIDALDVYKESIEFFGMQYKAFLASARSEMRMISSNYNSRVISRLGFVSEEIKELYIATLTDIETRAIEIGNYDAECILQALRNVETARNEAGDVIRNVTMTTISGIDELNNLLVYPLLDTIDELVALFEIEMLSLFRYFNPVTGMIQLVIELESEVRLYGALFEYFVSQIYTEMIIHGVYTDMTSGETFPLLSDSVDAFRNSTNIVLASLPACN